MSQDRRPSVEGDRVPPRTVAELVRGWWPGWIWAVPIAVVLVLSWLGLRYLTSGGEHITITLPNAHGVKPQSTEVDYRGVKVGTVVAVALGSKGKVVEITAKIDEAATKFLRTGTRFWLRGANPSLSNLSSLGAVLSGPTIVMQPGAGKKATHFSGQAHRPIVTVSPADAQDYEVSFRGAVGALEVGAGVTLRGFTVGKVEAVGFHYDAKTGALSTPVTLELYSSLFHVAGVSDLRAAIQRLVHEGLRARLVRSPPLIGGYHVALAMMPDAPPPASVLVNGMPQIPVAAGGGLTAILSRLNKVPVDRIAHNLLDVTRHLDGLVSSPKLTDSIAQLDAVLRKVHGTVVKTGPKLDALITALRRTAGQLDEAAQGADRALSGTQSQSGLPRTMREITRAARSVRELADYLDRHPEALVQGRPGG